MSIRHASPSLMVFSLQVAYPLFLLTMVLMAMRISPFFALLKARFSDHNRGSLLSPPAARGQVGFGVGGAAAGPLCAGLGCRSNTVLGALSVVQMGLMVWLLVPEPAAPETPDS